MQCGDLLTWFSTSRGEQRVVKNSHQRKREEGREGGDPPLTARNKDENLFLFLPSSPLVLKGKGGNISPRVLNLFPNNIASGKPGWVGSGSRNRIYLILSKPTFTKVIWGRYRIDSPVFFSQLEIRENAPRRPKIQDTTLHFPAAVSQPCIIFIGVIKRGGMRWGGGATFFKPDCQIAKKKEGKGKTQVV